METLSLAEKLFLLHYDNETGARGIIEGDPAVFQQVLVLAAIFELVLEGRLQIEGSGKDARIFAGDSAPRNSGKPVLDYVYRQIAVRQRTGREKSAPPALRDWMSERWILGERYEGVGIVYQRLLDEKIIELRDMNRSLTKSSSLARIRGEAIALSRRLAWNTRRVMPFGFGETRTTERQRLFPGKGGGIPANNGTVFSPEAKGAEEKWAEARFRAASYIVKHPFPGEHGKIKLALRRRLNNVLVSFVQLASVPQAPGVDRDVYKNGNSRIVGSVRETKRRQDHSADFLDGVLELGGTMVPSDIATIAALTNAARIPNSLFPINGKVKGDVLTAASEDLTAQKKAFNEMGECVRDYFSADARQVLAAAEEVDSLVSEVGLV